MYEKIKLEHSRISEEIITLQDELINVNHQVELWKKKVDADVTQESELKLGSDATQESELKLEADATLKGNRLTMYPPGPFFCVRDGKYTKWYLGHCKQRVILKKKYHDYAEVLAMQKYLTTRLEDLRSEQRALASYLKHHKIEQASRMLDVSSPYYDLLRSHYCTLSQDLLEWMNVPYLSNPISPEHLIYKAPSGHMVRSKSELIIASTLYLHQIPFRYECPLILDGATYYPDFTIRHPRTGKYYYYEHFGMMDNPGYIKKTCHKLEDYAMHGLIPSVNLLTSYETAAHPLDSGMVEDMIHMYFEV